MPRPKCLHPGCNRRPRRPGLCVDHTTEPVNKGGRPPSPPVEHTVASDRERIRVAGEIASLKRRYKDSLALIEQQQNELDVLATLKQDVAPFTIEPRYGGGTSEATAVLMASDWHAEEHVGDEVGGLNYNDLDTSHNKIEKFWQSGLRLVRLLQQDVRIDNCVLPLLGDFITGNIHGEENAEKNLLQPTAALVFAQNHIISGFEFLLNHSALTFTIPCHSGNHARTTKTTRFSAENGHSLEYLMYLHLAAYFRNEPRMRFKIAEGPHSYLDVYDKTLRFHHGHMIKYQGGVGGIYIPTNKAIAQWNKARHADYDVFGHYHQLVYGTNFICNGSIIGYNGFALSIKADYEPPQQGLFLMDKKRGRTCIWPVLVQ